MLQVLQLQCSKMESNLKKRKADGVGLSPRWYISCCSLSQPARSTIAPLDWNLSNPPHHSEQGKSSKTKSDQSDTPVPQISLTYPSKCTIGWGPLRVVNLDFLTLALILSPPSEPPFRLFYTFVTFWPFSPQAKIILQRIWVPQYAQKVQNCQLWEFLEWETTVCFWTFKNINQ